MVAVLLMVASSAFGKQGADVVKEVDAFTEINIVGKINVIYEQGSGYEVRLDGDAANCVDVKVHNSNLDLCPKSKVSKVGGVYYNVVDWEEGVTVYVKAPSVRYFNLAGSGSISVGKMGIKQVSFSVAGSGSIDIRQLSVYDVSFNVAGSGFLKARGVNASKANLSVAGSGSLNADLAKATELSCSVAGSGKITVSGKAGKYARSVYGSGLIVDKSLKYDKILKSSVGYDNNDVDSDYDNRRYDNGILSNP